MMKFCSSHIDALTTALKHKDLWRLTSQSEEQMHERTRLWLAGTASREHIDPMVICMLEITQKAVDACGQRLNHPMLEFCPLCEVERELRTADAGAQWIDNCSDMVLLLCKVNNVA